MDDYESLSHTKWECKYRFVFISKCRTKTPLMYAVAGGRVYQGKDCDTLGPFEAASRRMNLWR
jgi:hypothetical protein